MVLSIDELANDSIKAFYQAVFRYSAESATGTLFLATEANRSGQVVFNEGRVLGINYAGEVNHKAIQALMNQQSVRLSFADNVIFPLPETLLPEDAMALLSAMGYEAGNDPLEESSSLTTVASVEGETQSATERPQKTKPKRVYRGQIIE